MGSQRVGQDWVTELNSTTDWGSVRYYNSLSLVSDIIINQQLHSPIPKIERENVGKDRRKSLARLSQSREIQLLACIHQQWPTDMGVRGGVSRRESLAHSREHDSDWNTCGAQRQKLHIRSKPQGSYSPPEESREPWEGNLKVLNRERCLVVFCFCFLMRDGLKAAPPESGIPGPKSQWAMKS